MSGVRSFLTSMLVVGLASLFAASSAFALPSDHPVGGYEAINDELITLIALGWSDSSESTGAIAYDASAATVEAAIEGLSDSPAVTVVRAGADGDHTLSVTGADLGLSPAGWSDNFAWGKLTIQPGQKVILSDGNAAPGGGLYLGDLDFIGWGSTIQFGGVQVYFRNGGGDKKLYIGDITLDGKVNITDLGALASNWQATGTGWNQGDFTGNGMVNITDLGALASNWQAGVGAITVPEPASAALVALGALVMLRRRTRR